MPRTELIFYQEELGVVPVLDWLKSIRRADWRAYAKCIAALGRLAEYGHEVRRPLADLLGDGIYELRIRQGRVHYGILYFFQGKDSVVPGHGLTKEDRIPRADMERKLRRKRTFEAAPERHSYAEEVD